MSVTISGVDVEGALEGLEEETRAIEERLVGGPVPVSAIFEAASALEAAYIRYGYILARVVLPAQELRNGDRLRLVVVDGFVERIDTSAVPERIRRRIEQLTAPLVGKRGLRQGELERRLLLAGDTYGVSLSSAIATGETPGGTIIILEPEYQPITGFVGVNNNQTESLGEWTLNGGLELNSYLGFGETFYVRAFGYPSLGGNDGYFDSTPRNRALALGTVIPIGIDGLAFNVEYTDSRTTPDNDIIPNTSEFQRGSFRLQYPVVRSRALNLRTQAGLDLQRDKLDILSNAGRLPVYLDETSVIRLAVDSAWLPPTAGTIVEAGALLSFGIDAFGARTASDARGGTPLSRAGADATFSKMQLSARLFQPLAPQLALTVSGRAQTSFGDPLLTAERIGIASIRELSSFDDGTLKGDSGWALRGEIGRVVDLDWTNTPIDLRPYLFAAAGAVHREITFFAEEGTVRAHSLGAGVDVIVARDSAFSSASVRLELASGYRNDGGPDGQRFTVFGSFRF